MSVDGGLITILQQIINNKNNESDIDYAITQFLLKNLYNEKISASKISEACHTSIASITRFAQELGYTGFSDFKKDFDLLRFEKQEMQIDLKVFNKNKNRSKTNSTDLLRDEMREVAAVFTNYIEEIDLKMIEQLADLIHKADKVIIYSILIPGNLSLILQNMLLTAGKYVEYFPNTEHQFKSTETLNKNDLSLFISLEGSHIMNKELTLSVTESEAINVLITHNPEMKLGSLFDYIFPLGNHDIERSGKYKLLALIELLSHYYFKKYPL